MLDVPKKDQRTSEQADTTAPVARDPSTTASITTASVTTAAPVATPTPETVPAGDADTLADELEARLLLVPAAEISAATATAIVKGVTDTIGAVTGAIVLPTAQSFRVTAHRSTLPLVVLHQGQRPLRVALRLASPEVEFEGANPLVVVLQPGANDLEIPIRTRRSGEFDLTIEVISPDGALIMGTVPVEVQSRAISGVGILLSIGALTFLVVWWARNARRRARGGSTRHRRSTANPDRDHQHEASPLDPMDDVSRRDRGHLDLRLMSSAPTSAPTPPRAVVGAPPLDHDTNAGTPADHRQPPP